MAIITKIVYQFTEILARSMSKMAALKNCLKSHRIKEERCRNTLWPDRDV